MSLGLFIVGIVLTIVKVLFSHRTGNVEYRKKNYDKILSRIKKDSEVIHFTFEECTFTRLDTLKKIRSTSTSLGINKKGQ